MTVSEICAIDEARETCVIAGSYRIDIFGSPSTRTTTTSSAKLASWFTMLDRAGAMIVGHTFNSGFEMLLKKLRSIQKMGSESIPTLEFLMRDRLILVISQDSSGGEFGIWLKERV